jgi:glucose-6-phosphate isomerase
VDPVDVAKALNGLNPETTLVIVISKTFTTTETMLNARTVRWVAWVSRGRAGWVGAVMRSGGACGRG